MTSEKNLTMTVADAEGVEAIREFLSDWYSVADLFETAANAGRMLLELVNKQALPQDDLKYITSLIDQHVMLANLMKPFAGKEEKA